MVQGDGENSTEYGVRSTGYIIGKFEQRGHGPI